MDMQSKLKIEDQLLLFLAQTSIDTEKEIKIKDLLLNELDWDYILSKAAKHRLKSLLFFNLKNYSDIAPKDVLIRLNDYFSNNICKNLLFLGEILKIIKIFEKHSICVIPYKGPVTAIHAYGHLGLREFDDLDLYINKNDVLTVKKILQSEGYETKLHLDNSQEVEYLKLQSDYIFINNENDFPLEIHWNVAGFYFTFPNEHYFPFNPANLNFLHLNHQQVKIFSDEDQILILSIHAAGHLWSRLSWICDINELIRCSNDLDWNKIILKAKYLSVERILYVNLYLIGELFDLDVPSWIRENMLKDNAIEKIGEYVIKIIFEDKSLTIYNKLILLFKIREKKIMGLNDIWKILTIPNSNEWRDFEKKNIKGIYYVFKRPLQIMNRFK